MDAKALITGQRPPNRTLAHTLSGHMGRGLAQAREANPPVPAGALLGQLSPAPANWPLFECKRHGCFFSDLTLCRSRKAAGGPCRDARLLAHPPADVSACERCCGPVRLESGEPEMVTAEAGEGGSKVPNSSHLSAACRSHGRHLGAGVVEALPPHLAPTTSLARAIVKINRGVNSWTQRS
jgi:hypothetical protein